MKRFIFILSIIVLLCAVSGCSNSSGNDTSSASQTSSAETSTQKDDSEEQSAEQSADVSQTSEQTSESSSNGTNLVMKNFGELWMGDQYYIDVLMTQEYDESKFGTSSGETSSSAESSAVSEASEVSEKTDVSAESSSDSSMKTVTYDYIIAVDFKNDKAGLNMISEMGNRATVVDDYTIYEINHKDKTYTKSPYNGHAEDFGEEFTVKICLGIINNCTLVDSGKTTYKGQDVLFEKYTVQSQLPGVSDPEITYYFDSSQKPVAEEVVTETGKSTFTFRTVSNTIPVQDILKVPAVYKEVSESSASE